jgi:cell wall-associated NlpC family hydrolase
MVSQVGRYQQSVVGELAIARADQENATEAAKQAAAAASDAAAVAAERSTAATAAADRARATAIDAADADAAAHAAALAAAAAKRQAAADVDAQVGRVSHLYANVKDLERQAAEARRQAALARRHQQVAPSAAAATAVRWAYKEIGVPYSWGGGNAQGPTYGVAQGANILGFDCSGLTLFAYAHAGIQLDHYTGSQWQSGPHVSQGQLRPGDLVFFATDTSNAATIHHVGLFIGNGMMIEAPETGLVVRVAPAFRPGYIGAVRPWATVIG